MGKMRLDIKRKFTARTDRVKCVDIHPTEPWVLAALYNGSVWVWNYETQATVKTIEVSELPLRAAKFIPRKSWIVGGGDEMQLKVFNYNTLEKVAQVDAHSDYIRSISVHPTQPMVLSCGDDFTIKLWDYERNWKNLMTFEGHTHFIFQVAFNPKDANTFASAALDCTVKVWNINSPTANFTLQGHEKAVNCLGYYPGADKPYLMSGGDDHKVRVWDLQNKTCVATLDGHTQNVIVAEFHPELPIALTGAEDGTIKVWNATTWKLEHSLNYGMERVWSLAVVKGSSTIAAGYDEGCVVLNLGREDPAVSMDNQGKVVWSKHNTIMSTNLRAFAEPAASTAAVGPDGAPLSAVATTPGAAASMPTTADGERISTPAKELGTCEVYPTAMTHSPNGRFVVVTGDGEYIIYTALAWRNKAYGSAIEFAWSPTNEYAIRETASRIKLFDKQFKEKPVAAAGGLHQLNYAADAMFGGSLLGVRSAAGFVTFYDWDTARIVRRIEAPARAVHWNDAGDLVALVTDDSVFVLRYHADAWAAAAGTPAAASEEGVEAAFSVLHEVPEAVKTGVWVGDCFLFTSGGAGGNSGGPGSGGTAAGSRLAYIVGGQVFTVTQFDSPMYLLGYVAKDNRVYYADKDANYYAWALPVATIQYQTAILRGDAAAAEAALPGVPATERGKLARFLETQGLVELALEVTPDAEHKFDLAVAAGKLDVALAMAAEVDQPSKWKVVAEGALATWRFDIAEECLDRAGDLESLMLVYLAAGNAAGLRRVADRARDARKHNVALAAYAALGDVAAQIAVLAETHREPEAALLAAATAPASLAPAAVAAWRAALPSRAAGTIADLDPSLVGCSSAEELAAAEAVAARRIPAREYPSYRESVAATAVEWLHAEAAAASEASHHATPPASTTTAEEAAAIDLPAE
ncbi:coatomer WD associated region-domain-containing protein [Blastocladiella britannica]|nr:coatomer WD associated region-domain-containing protein [Blastocladiella britannica]